MADNNTTILASAVAALGSIAGAIIVSHKNKSKKDLIKEYISVCHNHYGPDRTLLYELHHSGAKTIYDVHSFSLMIEKKKKHIASVMPVQNNKMSMSLFHNFMKIYHQDRLHHSDLRTETRESFRSINVAEDIKVTYSMLFYDYKMQPSCILVMNWMYDYKTVDDLELFKNIGSSVGLLLTK